MCLLDLFRGIGAERWDVEIACTWLGKIFLRGTNAETWSDYWKKNFFINNSVRLSMCDSLIETVAYIWVNI